MSLFIAKVTLLKGLSISSHLRWPEVMLYLLFIVGVELNTNKKKKIKNLIKTKREHVLVQDQAHLIHLKSL